MAYFPHHEVFKIGNRSNPIRVVCDASATKENEKSFNQCTLKGPTTRNKISDILMKFRKNKIAVMVDLKQMDPQVLMNQGSA
jgi:hypothetical protein